MRAASWRTGPHGLDVRPAVQRLRPIKSEDFGPFLPATSRPDTASFTRCTHSAVMAAAPVLRVQVFPQPSPVQALQDLRMRVDGRLARFHATVELTTPQNDLSFFEWDLLSQQPLTIASVTGAGVRNWSQSDRRLLVWLEKTGAAAKLEIFGWLPLALPKEGPRLELPCLRPHGAQSHQTTVRVVAGAGLSVVPVQLKNLLPCPVSSPAIPTWRTPRNRRPTTAPSSSARRGQRRRADPHVRGRSSNGKCGSPRRRLSRPARRTTCRANPPARLGRQGGSASQRTTSCRRTNAAAAAMSGPGRWNRARAYVPPFGPGGACWRGRAPGYAARGRCRVLPDDAERRVAGR